MKSFCDLYRMAGRASIITLACVAFLWSACDKTSSPATPTPTGNSGGTTPTSPPPVTPPAPPAVSGVSPQQGPGATSVTITGTGFSDTTAHDTVYFNGKMAKISAATTTQLTVVVPALAGTGPVAVRVHGDSVTGPTFTYQYQYVVTTLAGGSQGDVDGTGSAASFDYMVGIAADAAGNLYIGDQFNEKVRKVTPAGVVTTFAGNGTYGHIDGAGSQAEFYYPTGIAVDNGGNVYVAELGGNRIRAITPAGVVSTLSGTGMNGATDGGFGVATYSNPTGLVLDPTQSFLYVVDASNNKIRKVDALGNVSTFAGSGALGSANGTGTAASFHYPYGIASDAAGNLYIADQKNNLVRKVTAAGVVSTLAGSGTPGSADGTGTAAGFSSPCGVAVDSVGNVYVADVGNDEIRMITPAGVVTTVAGSSQQGSADGTGSAASFEFPYGITIFGGNLYVTDQGNEKIRKIVIQ
jgi:serine/threonine protein kinase, bacterial